MRSEDLVAPFPVGLRCARSEGGRIARPLPSGMGLGRPPSEGADRRRRVGHALEDFEAPFPTSEEPPAGASTMGEDPSVLGAACAVPAPGMPESSVAPANTPVFLRISRRDGTSVMVLHSLTDQEPVAESA